MVSPLNYAFLPSIKGGGDVQIVDRKLDFNANSKSRVNSLANANYVPGGGNVKVGHHSQVNNFTFHEERIRIRYLRVKQGPPAF